MTISFRMREMTTLPDRVQTSMMPMPWGWRTAMRTTRRSRKRIERREEVLKPKLEKAKMPSNGRTL